MACPGRANGENIEKATTRTTIRAHLVRIPFMSCIDRSSKEVLQRHRNPGESVLGFRGGSFQVPYGVLQCIRKPKSLIARRVADFRGSRKQAAELPHAGPIHPQVPPDRQAMILM